MGETKFVSFKELFPSGLDGSGKEKGSSTGVKNYLHVSDVVNLELIVDKFDFESGDRGETLYIHSDKGIIRTYSRMLINQARAIQQKVGDKKLKLTITSQKSKKNPMQTFYMFS